MKMNVRWQKWGLDQWFLRGSCAIVAEILLVKNPYWSSDKLSLRYQPHYMGSSVLGHRGKLYLTLQDAKKEVERRLKLEASVSHK